MSELTLGDITAEYDKEIGQLRGQIIRSNVVFNKEREKQQATIEDLKQQIAALNATVQQQQERLQEASGALEAQWDHHAECEPPVDAERVAPHIVNRI